MFIVHVHCSLFMFIVHCSHGATLIFDDVFLVKFPCNVNGETFPPRKDSQGKHSPGYTANPKGHPKRKTIINGGCGRF